MFCDISTGIELCQAVDFIYAICGFRLHFDDNTQVEIASQVFPIIWPFERISFRAGEVVHRIDVHHWAQGPTNYWRLLMGLTFYTNVATYGPIGNVTGSDYVAVLRGYNLIGLHGGAGAAVDYIGATFERCNDDVYETNNLEQLVANQDDYNVYDYTMTYD